MYVCGFFILLLLFCFRLTFIYSACIFWANIYNNSTREIISHNAVTEEACSLKHIRIQFNEEKKDILGEMKIIQLFLLFISELAVRLNANNFSSINLLPSGVCFSILKTTYHFFKSIWWNVELFYLLNQLEFVSFDVAFIAVLFQGKETSTADSSLRALTSCNYVASAYGCVRCLSCSCVFFIFYMPLFLFLCRVAVVFYSMQI